MLSFDVIDSFFEAYQAHWDKEYKLDPHESTLAEESNLIWIEQLRLAAPVITRDVLSNLRKRYMVSIKYPDYYTYFLMKKSYDRLDTPLIAFPKTKPPFGELKEMIDRCKDSRLIPIGHDTDSSGILCIDMEHEEMIICWDYSEETPTDLGGPVCASFCHMLKILTELLRASIPWCGAASPERTELINRIKSIDPNVFGGAAWENRWRYQLIRK